MSIHRAKRRPVVVRVINSRLPVHNVVYGDGIGDVVYCLFRRIALKAIPIAKQLGMKIIDVVRDKAIGTVGDAAGKGFAAVIDRLARLIRRKPQSQPVKMHSSEVMSAGVNTIINQTANERLKELACVPSLTKQQAAER